MSEPNTRRSEALGWILLISFLISPLIVILALWHRVGFMPACEWAGWTWPVLALLAFAWEKPDAEHGDALGLELRQYARIGAAIFTGFLVAGVLLWNLVSPWWGLMSIVTGVVVMLLGAWMVHVATDQSKPH